MGSLGTDELYFYLIARFYILKGNALENKSSFYDSLQTVDFKEISDILINFIPDSEFRKRVEAAMHQNVIFVKSKQYV